MPGLIVALVVLALAVGTRSAPARIKGLCRELAAEAAMAPCAVCLTGAALVARARAHWPARGWLLAVAAFPRRTGYPRVLET